MTIILTGFSGTGKTAVGQRVARGLGWEFADTDQLIVQRVGKPISRIFAEEGEPAFREHEREAVADACGRPRTVVSTGGGAIMDDANRRAMLNAGLLVCLEATPETIYARLQGAAANEDSDTVVRPLLEGSAHNPLERIESLKQERQWAYALAQWTVPTDALSVEQVAQEILRAWRRFGPPLMAGDDPHLAATVVTEGGSYPVTVGWDILEQQIGKRMVAAGLQGRAYVICDQNVIHPYGRMVQRSLHKAGIEAHLFLFPPGEASKSLATAETLYGWLAERQMERRDTIVAVGGGVAGDLAGFLAATYLRGVSLVQVPTSLVAMVDSSIGGKTAVDLPAGKNLVGAFHQPSLVLADVSALATLPERALREGWAEALKHGLIMDASLVETYESRAEGLLSLEPELTTEVVARNAALKARVVTQDERETTGLRTLLNYGHTIGHGVEAASGYDGYLHGEAVAIGMIGAAKLGLRAGVTPGDVVERQQALLQRFGLPDRVEGVSKAAVLDAMARDKKSSLGQVSWVLLEAVGRATVHRGVPSEDVDSVLTELGAS